MNRKFLLFVTCITLQYSTMIFADNWNAVFTALNGAFSRDRLSTTTANRLLVSLAKTPEGSIAIKYVSGQALSSADMAQYTTALATFQNGGVVTPPPANGSTPTGDTVNANWDTAIAAFGTAQNVFNKATTITRTIPSSIPTTAAYYKDAQVVLQYLNGATLNTTDAAQLDAAFTRANVSRSTITPTTTATDTAAAALKTQIEAAKLVYNQYKPGTYTVTA